MKLNHDFLGILQFFSYLKIYDHRPYPMLYIKCFLFGIYQQLNGDIFLRIYKFLSLS